MELSGKHAAPGKLLDDLRNIMHQYQRMPPASSAFYFHIKPI